MTTKNEPMDASGGIIKIAAVTHDGVTIAGHFGMAEYYQVVAVESGRITSEEKRPKPHHMMHPNPEQAQQHDHQDMLAPIHDCQVLLSGGMRERAYEHAQAAGLEVILALGNIDEAVRQYMKGELVSETRRIRPM